MKIKCPYCDHVRNEDEFEFVEYDDLGMKAIADAYYLCPSCENYIDYYDRSIDINEN